MLQTREKVNKIAQVSLTCASERTYKMQNTYNGQLLFLDISYIYALKEYFL